MNFPFRMVDAFLARWFGPQREARRLDRDAATIIETAQSLPSSSKTRETALRIRDELEVAHARGGDDPSRYTRLLEHFRKSASRSPATTRRHRPYRPDAGHHLSAGQRWSAPVPARHVTVSTRSSPSGRGSDPPCLSPARRGRDRAFRLGPCASEVMPLDVVPAISPNDRVANASSPPGA